ncbi:MAG TPA: VWA domain-containing protein [Gemmataceae bacterium]|nr:VWA domain-containing protein [Gemmataceae bacterium]
MLTRVFTEPVFLLALASLPVLGILVFVARRRKRQLISRLGPAGVIASQTERPAGRWRSAVGWTLGLVLLAVGTAGPRWGLGPSPPTAPGRDIVVVVDLSRSMLAQDALPSRLGKAKEALQEFADAVQSRGGHRLGLVAFAGQAAVVCPLTHDYDHFRAKVAALSADPPPATVRSLPVSGSGTRIGTGLQRAVALLDPQFRGAEEIVLLSDGDDPAGDEEWRYGLTAARESGVPVDVVGIGDPNADSPIPTETGRLAFHGAEVHTRLHEAPLREIANRTGGEYLAARTGPVTLDGLFRRRIAVGPTREAVAGTLPQPVGRQTLFLGLALTFIMGTMLSLSPRAGVRGLFRAGRRLVLRARRPALALVGVALVSAMPPVDWLRCGNDSLAAGQPDAALADFAHAAARTTDPGLVAFNQGVALFRLGRFRDAELHFRRCLSDATGGRRVRARYNLGSSLLQESQGRMVGPLRAAVASFEEAVAVIHDGDPLADDLRHNLELSKSLLAAARQAQPNSPDEPPDGTPPDRPPPSPGGPDERSAVADGREPTRGQLGPDGKPTPNGKTDGRMTPQSTDKSSPPGKGNLPPLPDEDALSPMTPEDAQAHLEKAAERIAAERRAQLRRTAPSPATTFPDW